jgi:catechol 2,3-dioxygenase-like lactoylglutathione lyase family enzyme
MNARSGIARAAVVTVALVAAAACGSEPAPPPAAETPETETAPVIPTIAATNAFYYYADVEAAWRFYTEVLGLETAADFGFAKIMRVAPASYLTLVDAERGMHSADEPKTATLALVTDEVEGWYDYLSAAGVEMRAGFNPQEGRPHVGFVAIDPEGYFLEFERFEPHEENVDLLPALERLQPLYPAPELETNRPAELGVRATVQWLYYRDTAAINRFYTALFGAGPIVDQGWAWAYQASASGFLGIVDGERGLHQATDEKGVTFSLLVDDIEAWVERMRGIEGFEARSEQIGDESGRVRTFVGYDPEGYFLEWDTFLDVEGNETLLGQLRGR